MVVYKSARYSGASAKYVSFRPATVVDSDAPAEEFKPFFLSFYVMNTSGIFTVVTDTDICFQPIFFFASRASSRAC